MFQGVSVEGICESLRLLPLLRQLATDVPIVVLCAMEKRQQDTIQVTVVGNQPCKAKHSNCLLFKRLPTFGFVRQSCYSHVIVGGYRHY